MKILFIALGLFTILLFGMMFLSYIQPNNKWFCRVMGWHKQPLTNEFDGCSSTGNCPRCNKAVLQDSQGNWF